MILRSVTEKKIVNVYQTLNYGTSI